MALSELVAFEAAYQVLQPLDDAGRRRALQWLTDALGERKTLAHGARSEAQSAAEPAAESNGRRRGRGAAKRAAKAVAAKRGGRRAAAHAAPGRRIRRQMPPAEQVIAAYEQAGTINGLADHFDVPTHTVYSWARTLRS